MGEDSIVEAPPRPSAMVGESPEMEALPSPVTESLEPQTLPPAAVPKLPESEAPSSEPVSASVGLEPPLSAMVAESVELEVSPPSETVAEPAESEGSQPTPAPITDEPEPPSAAEPQADLRARVLAQFEQWLDQTLADEPPPRGMPENLLTEAIAIASGQQTAPESDLYTLFASLTTLTGEIRLQGRAFKQLSDLLAPLSGTPALLEQLHEAQLESAASIQALAEPLDEDDGPPVEFKQVCGVMIDLYDRLQRGLQTCDEGIASLQSRRKTGWLHRLLGQVDALEKAILSVQAIREASALTLARLQASLQEWGIQRLGRIGEEFDPDRMTAVDVRPDNAVPPGTVLLVNRSGYAINGTVKATAQVTVSKGV